MAGTMNTQASEFPADPQILDTGTTNADEFRDLELTDTAVKHKADFSSVPNETLGRPTDRRSDAVQERRLYANSPDAVSSENVTNQGARRYASFTIVLPGGTDGYPGEPSLILGEDTSRTRIVISHGDTSFVNLGPREQVALGAGLRLSADLLFETTVQGAVYGSAPVGAINPITVSVWAEYA